MADTALTQQQKLETMARQLGLDEHKPVPPRRDQTEPNPKGKQK